MVRNWDLRLVSALRLRWQLRVFDALYRYGGRIYDPLTRWLFAGEWDRWRLAVLASVPGGRALDVGCGTGALVDAATRSGLTAVGIDRSTSMLGAARRRFGNRINIIQASAECLPFAGATFDCVVATFPAPFIRERAAVDEIARVLRAGGTLSIVVGGTVSQWPARYRPIELALRLFYGPARSGDDPCGRRPFIDDQRFDGRWQQVQTMRGYADIWSATRVAPACPETPVTASPGTYR